MPPVRQGFRPRPRLCRGTVLLSGLRFALRDQRQGEIARVGHGAGEDGRIMRGIWDARHRRVVSSPPYPAAMDVKSLRDRCLVRLVLSRPRSSLDRRCPGNMGRMLFRKLKHKQGRQTYASNQAGVCHSLLRHFLRSGTHHQSL